MIGFRSVMREKVSNVDLVLAFLRNHHAQGKISFLALCCQRHHVQKWISHNPLFFCCCFWSPTQRLTWKTIENEPSPISVFDFKTHLLRYNDRVDEEKMKGASRYANQHVYFRSSLSTSRKKNNKHVAPWPQSELWSLKKNLSRQFPRR